MAEVEGKLHAWKKDKRYSAIVLGVDLNFTLPGNLGDMTGINVAARKVKHFDRLQSIIRFLTDFSLKAANTMGETKLDDEDIYTWRNKKATQKTQIDYIFASDNLNFKAEPMRIAGLVSDHTPIVGNAVAMESYATYTRSSPSWKGWRLQSDLRVFQINLMKHCGFEDGLLDKEI